jgi:uncharacterized hydantoinase/oxoprolinase family protein
MSKHIFISKDLKPWVKNDVEAMNLAYNECWRQKDKLERQLDEAKDFANDKVRLCLHLTEQNNKLEKENANLKKLIYKCKSLMHARSSFEAYEIWEEVEEQLKEQGE